MNKIKGLVAQINCYKAEMRKTLNKKEISPLEMHSILFDLKDLNELVNGLRIMTEQACLTDFQIMVSQDKSYDAIDKFMRALSYKNKEFSRYWRNMVTDVNVAEGHFTIRNMREQFRISIDFIEKSISHVEEKQLALADAVEKYGKPDLANIIKITEISQK